MLCMAVTGHELRRFQAGSLCPACTESCEPPGNFWRTSFPPRSECHDKGKEEEPEIEPEALLSNVKQVIPELLPSGEFAVAIELGQTRQTGANNVSAVEIPDFLAKLPDELRPLRPRSHKAHVAAEDVPELGKLVEGHGAKDAANASDARVALRRWYGPPFLIRVGNHRAELDTPELPAVFSYAGLSVECGPAIVEFDSKGNQAPKRQRNSQPNPGEQDVEDSLEQEARRADASELSRYGVCIPHA